ncbi:MAG: fructose-6-phosphate aldolase [Gemmatimonadetes bacterium]|uniref:Probable transaldolase n=1 Tax=Candidatus Kutchimonas denitrificans TaxID=3056748 RepID=A0AAE4Z6P5_9BACT|nr:fructose-6-phosphate aldolase [Gemmatimonadota bacterium]NIR74603.1 fructose-6-phosphate aldolase [Candidatus Kutchimonas denitrificans]NIS02793.1 fructose-6-phosphate aldolase [Gemmatimonadota bacterium]NIT68954.1 fructose-6-phosphate aldolase [Gemmatimonadota bacterium]NIU52259.1 fructose-6-phosphate aldolase [Gemmatimonadota bacterium]
MKIFVDTADLKEIRRAAKAGLIDGITTNPSLLSKVLGDRSLADCLKEIADAVDGPVSLEVLATDTDGMVAQGRELASIAENVVVKVPLTEDGLVACRQLRGEGIGVNVTLCFSPSQALLAAKAGARFVSPFIGRIDDISHEGMGIISQIREIYDNYGFETEILAASIRHPLHVVEAALLGADIVTVPPEVLWKLVNHPLTDRGLERFIEDARKADIEIPTRESAEA